MEKVQRILDIVTIMSNTMRVRDRSVKVIQYGCQMLIGFYASKLNENTLTVLKNTRRTASTARKAFWLLKSLNHVTVLAQKIPTYTLRADPYFTEGLDLIEQFSLVLYFWYENLVFLARNGLVGFEEDSVEFECNITWFLGDLACFIATIIRFGQNFKEVADNLQRVQNLHKANLVDDNHTLPKTATLGGSTRSRFGKELSLKSTAVTSSPSGDLESARADLDLAIQALQRRSLSLTIVLLPLSTKI